MDTDLPSRLQLILEEYDYIVRDEDSVAAALQKIHNYAAKTEADTWEELVERLCFQCSNVLCIHSISGRSTRTWRWPVKMCPCCSPPCPQRTNLMDSIFSSPQK